MNVLKFSEIFNEKVKNQMATFQINGTKNSPSHVETTITPMSKIICRWFPSVEKTFLKELQIESMENFV